MHAVYCYKPAEFVGKHHWWLNRQGDCGTVLNAKRKNTLLTNYELSYRSTMAFYHSFFPPIVIQRQIGK